VVRDVGKKLFVREADAVDDLDIPDQQLRFGGSERHATAFAGARGA
jgi:hypothetical protein